MRGSREHVRYKTDHSVPVGNGYRVVIGSQWRADARQRTALRSSGVGVRTGPDRLSLSTRRLSRAGNTLVTLSSMSSCRATTIVGMLCRARGDNIRTTTKHGEKKRTKYQQRHVTAGAPTRKYHGGRELVNGVDLESTKRSINVKQIDQ